MMREEKILVFLLRLSGGITLLAFFAIFIPVDVMESTHHKLGLGEFPRAPVVDYLTRSIAALYGFFGGLSLLVSTDIRCYRRIVVYIAAMNLLFGAGVTAIDYHAGMPLYWTLSEGLPVIALGLLMFYLLSSVPRG
jgi:hypothetical protein